jgi:photosystem II stability/assembly factor-like uncharacterized protein
VHRRIVSVLILAALSGRPLAAGVNRWTSGTPYWGPRYCWQITPHPRVPGLLFAATSDGMLRSDDRGATWRPILRRSQVALFSMAIDPRSDRVLYAASLDGGVLRSRDGGATWAPASDSSAPYVNTLAISPSAPERLFAAESGTNPTIYRSLDSGASWTGVLTVPSAGEIVVHPTNSSIVLATAGIEGIMMSTDGGSHWSPSNRGLPALDARSIAFDSVEPQRLYLVDSGAVYRSTDGGSSWTLVLGGSIAFQRVVAHSGISGTAYAWSVNRVYRTTDGGVHWTTLPPTPGTTSISDVAGEPGVETNFYAAAYALYRSQDAGRSWATVGRQDPRIAGTDLVAPPDEPDAIYALGGSRRFSYSLDRGETWTFAANAGLDSLYGLDLAISTAAAPVIYAGTANGIFRTEDRGDHWTGLGPFDEVTRIVVDPANVDRIYADTRVECGRFYCLYRGDRSIDGGHNWSELQTDGAEGAVPRFVSASAPQHVFGYTADLFDPPSLLWGDLDGPLAPLVDAPTLFSMVQDSSDRSAIYGVGYRDSEQGLFRSDDGGETWTLVSDALVSASRLAIDPADPRRLAAIGLEGLLLSTDHGATWSSFAGPPTEVGFGSLAFSADGLTLYAGNAYGVYQYTFCETCRPLVDAARRAPGTLPDRP